MRSISDELKTYESQGQTVNKYLIRYLFMDKFLSMTLKHLIKSVF